MRYTVLFCDAKVDHRKERSFLRWRGCVVQRATKWKSYFTYMFVLEVFMSLVTVVYAKIQYGDKTTANFKKLMKN